MSTPTAPPAITGNFSPGTPTAPRVATGNFSPGTPTAPGAATGNFSPGTPTAPRVATGNFSPGTPTAPRAASVSYAAPTPAVPGVRQVLTLVFETAALSTGNLFLDCESSPGWWKAPLEDPQAVLPVFVPIVSGDSGVVVAGKVRAALALSLNEDWIRVFEVGGTGNAVTFTRKEILANEAGAKVVTSLTEPFVYANDLESTVTTAGALAVPGLDAPAAVTTDFS